MNQRDAPLAAMIARGMSHRLRTVHELVPWRKRLLAGWPTSLSRTPTTPLGLRRSAEVPGGPAPRNGPFYEYFHGDNGLASHQTGWTASSCDAYKLPPARRNRWNPHGAAVVETESVWSRQLAGRRGGTHMHFRGEKSAIEQLLCTSLLWASSIFVNGCCRSMPERFRDLAQGQSPDVHCSTAA